MKLKLLPFSAAVLATIGMTNLVQAVTVDGIRDTTGPGEYTGAIAVFNQATVSNWTDGGGQEALANIHAVQDGNTLAIHLAARVNARAIILFIDSKTGGRTFISKPLITFGGEGDAINNLGTNTVSGMTFETGFTPDYAIRIYGDGGTGAFVNTYDLTAGTRTEAGNAGVAVISSGFISQMRANSLETVGTVDSADYSAANKGVEMKLDLAALGVPFGPQTVKLMAVLVNVDSTYGSNQVLASRTTNADIAEAINSINFQTESGTQTIDLAVNGPASRPVVFSVDMNQEVAKGFFNPTNDRVKVLFFSGMAYPTPGEIYLTDDNNDKIYTGTLMATGTEGNPFGEYKFYNTRGSPNSGFEWGLDNRNFTLGPLYDTQTLDTVPFRSSYIVWAAEFSEGQPATGDKDGDGVKNGVEYFMGSNNSTFTPNPAPVSGVVSWPRILDITGIAYKVEVSSDLSTWQNAALAYPGQVTDSGTQVSFTLPPGAGKIFTRLNVTP